MRIYFDTNIWIDYAWSYFKSSRPKAKIRNLIEKIETEEHTVVSSVFGMTEISSHFKDWHTLQKIIKNGYSYRELSNLKREKKYNQLTRRQTEKIDGYLEQINQLNWVDSVEINNIEKIAINLFTILTLEYYLEFADAFHIIIAMSENCPILITKDKSMRENGMAFVNNSGLNDEFQICNIEQFMNMHI